MEKSHTQSRKANRGKRGDSPQKGLPTIKVEFAPRRYRDELDLSGFTLVQDEKKLKPPFLRRNELIKKENA